MPIKDIIKAAFAEQPSTVKELVHNELYNRAMAAVDELRSEIAPGLFNVNESEQLDELSKGTLASYAKKQLMM